MTNEIEINPGTGRLSVATVRELERLLGGDPQTEEQIMQFVGGRYGAANLLYLPANVAAEVIRRPHDFSAAARRWAAEKVES